MTTLTNATITKGIWQEAITHWVEVPSADLECLVSLALGKQLPSYG